MSGSKGTTNGSGNGPHQGGLPLLKCSLCGKLYDPAAVKTRPFCSRRCQQIDLGNWLQEAYGLPTESELERQQEDPRDEEQDP